MLDLAVNPGNATLTDGGGYTAVVELTKGTAAPTSGALRDLDNPNRWCVSLTDLSGRFKEYRFSAANGLEPGTC